MNYLKFLLMVNDGRQALVEFVENLLTNFLPLFHEPVFIEEVRKPLNLCESVEMRIAAEDEEGEWDMLLRRADSRESRRCGNNKPKIEEEISPCFHAKQNHFQAKYDEQQENDDAFFVSLVQIAIRQQKNDMYEAHLNSEKRKTISHYKQAKINHYIFH